MLSRRLSPDTALEIALNGTSGRLAGDKAAAETAAAELRTLAAGRADLLARAAGGKLGGFIANRA